MIYEVDFHVIKLFMNQFIFQTLLREIKPVAQISNRYTIELILAQLNGKTQLWAEIPCNMTKKMMDVRKGYDHEYNYPYFQVRMFIMMNIEYLKKR